MVSSEDCSPKRPPSTPKVDSQGKKKVYQPQGSMCFHTRRRPGGISVTVLDFSIFETTENLMAETDSFLHIEALSLSCADAPVPKFNQKLLSWEKQCKRRLLQGQGTILYASPLVRKNGDAYLLGLWGSNSLFTEVYVGHLRQCLCMR